MAPRLHRLAAERRAAAAAAARRAAEPPAVYIMLASAEEFIRVIYEFAERLAAEQEWTEAKLAEETRELAERLAAEAHAELAEEILQRLRAPSSLWATTRQCAGSVSSAPASL